MVQFCRFRFAHRNTHPVRVRCRQPFRRPYARPILHQSHRRRGRRPLHRKYTLIITDLARVVVAFGFLLVRTADDVWLLYVLTALQLGIGGFFFPTRNAILPDIVSSQELGAANALGSATWSVMLALGAAIGGIVSGAWGIYPAFVIDGLTFLLSAVFIAQIKLDVEPDLAGSDKTMGGALKEYLDGLRYLGRHTDTLVVALHKAASALMMGSGISGSNGRYR